MKKEKKIGLTTMIFIALILGAVTGVIINLTLSSNKFVMDYVVNGAFYIVGQGFIRGMQMLVVPLVFCSIVCGAAAIGDTKTLGKVGLKTVMFYMATTVLAVTLALGVANVINPGKGANLAKMMTAAKAAGSTVGKTTTSTSAVDTILNIIPTNPIQALANGDMLAIIFFALLIGIILAKLGERVQLMTNFFSQGNDIMMEMTMMVMKVAPIAVYCLIARTFSSMGFSVIIYMLKYVIAVLIALLLQGFGVYQILLFIFTRLNPFKFIKKFFPVMAFAFSTATSNATIPLSIETLEDRSNGQYGWNFHYAGCCCCLCCAGLWHYFNTNEYANSYSDSYIGINRYGWCAFSWIDYADNGIQFSRSSCSRYHINYGY